MFIVLAFFFIYKTELILTLLLFHTLAVRARIRKSHFLDVALPAVGRVAAQDGT